MNRNFILKPQREINLGFNSEYCVVFTAVSLLVEKQAHNFRHPERDWGCRQGHCRARADKIGLLLANADLREKLHRHGENWATGFRWANTARAIWEETVKISKQ